MAAANAIDVEQRRLIDLGSLLGSTFKHRKTPKNHNGRRRLNHRAGFKSQTTCLSKIEGNRLNAAYRRAWHKLHIPRCLHLANMLKGLRAQTRCP